ncbi:ABC transporter substrate-binding protein [Blastomonas marina]|uniref:ABC transporter substrate-binding protein n=1 Tax=Blastomonas marina TaxID=1867408 RepID=A0ABQ1FFC4_9SPHN|nr:MlaD family protein [Blastomonas marina]GGA08855.1 ABC transporter substrate-binding protein [Blastomonas marina]
METRANYIWVGAVTLALLAALGLFIVWLAQINDGSKRQYDIFFPQSVDGLANGSPVSFSGVPAGEVKQIELWPEDPSKVRVRIEVNDDIPIRQGTEAFVQGSFTGISTIQLTGAQANTPPITKLGPEGKPVIPPRQGGLGAILSNAPEVLEKLSTLTERLTELLNPENQNTLAGILRNTERLSDSLADQSPMITATMEELNRTLAQAGATLAQFEQVAGSTDRILNQEGASVAQELRRTLAKARETADTLDATLESIQPAAKRVNESTLPAAEAAIKDLQATTRALRQLTERIEQQGASGLLSSPPLPDYEP